jgi:hypothetical protein
MRQLSRVVVIAGVAATLGVAAVPAQADTPNTFPDQAIGLQSSWSGPSSGSPQPDCDAAAFDPLQSSWSGTSFGAAQSSWSMLVLHSPQSSWSAPTRAYLLRRSGHKLAV